VSFDGRIWYLANTDKYGRTTLSKQINASMVKSDKRIKGVRDGTWLGDEYFTKTGLRAISTSLEFAAGRADHEVLALIDGGGKLDSIDSITRDGAALIRLKIIAPNPLRVYADKTDRTAAYRITAGMTVSGRNQFMAHWEASKELPANRDYVFYLDASRNYAVVGREERYGERLLSETVNEAFRQIPGRDLWLPGKSTTTNYTSSNNVTLLSDTPLWRQNIVLKETSFAAAPAERFVIDYHKPGTQIFDRTTPDKPLVYSAKAGASASQPGPAAAYEPLANVPAAPSAIEDHSYSIWIIALVVALMTALGGWTYIRRREARR
jgi:hypothetical protein